MAVIVFDLDMTIIDSSHRHLSNPDGSINLAAWFENATPEKIAADKLMPLAAAVRRLYDAGHHIVLCTARTMSQADYSFIANHSEMLPHHILYSRIRGDTRSDELIKLEQIAEYVQTNGFASFEDANVIIFEDNLKTIAAFEAKGAIGVDAIWANRSEQNRKVA